MRKLLGTLALLPIGLPALAQIPGAGRSSVPAQKATDAVVLQTPSSLGCPVGFAARHGQEGAVVNVGPRSKHPEQSYRITLTPFKAAGIVAAEVTLHGISGLHVLPAGRTVDGRPDATESFNLSPSPGEKAMFQSTVYTRKLTGVQWVELNELTYADGTRWQASSEANCRVVPNGFMLVAGTH